MNSYITWKVMGKVFDLLSFASLAAAVITGIVRSKLLKKLFLKKGDSKT